MCEDRGIEPYMRLLGQTNGHNVYGRLFELFQQADDRYNSGLFHFRDEKGRNEAADTLTPALKVDDKPLRDIIKNLYYPDSPYEFAVLPADILGQVYEQFLGKVIRLTAGHHAVVEDKPEVKKAGGVYYTPTYIVEYIVENTVGKLLEGKTPKQAAKLRILDPACGSGSFLIGAYQRLMTWHRDWYLEDGTEKHTKEIYQGPGGEWRLTTAERKRILLNNIYGVDIDPQAVEVTKLSLLLKVLEGESDETLAKQLQLFHERALPDLSENIKCGNSLVGMDYYDHQQMTLLDEEGLLQINAFDWNAEFADAMAPGGFDAIIGNPPYVRPHNLQAASKDYFWKHYETFVKKSDLYCCFVEKSISLLKNNGYFGFIISNGWLRLDSFQKLRSLLLKSTIIQTIIDFTGNVFAKANVKAAILIFMKHVPDNSIVRVSEAAPGSNLFSLEFNQIAQDAYNSTYKNIFDLSINETDERIKRKLRESGVTIGTVFDISFGLKTGDDSKFLTYSPDCDECKPLLRGEDVHRYYYLFKGEYVRYLPQEMRDHRKTARPGIASRFEQPKVLVRDTGGGLESTFERDNYYVKDVLVIADNGMNTEKLLALCAIINSKLMAFYYETSFPTLHVQSEELGSLPLPVEMSREALSGKTCKQLADAAQNIIDLIKAKLSSKVPEETESIQRKIESISHRIDRMVYEYYHLSDDEIRVVERTFAEKKLPVASPLDQP
jgi:type I restriction-modification system DNA methylase subunit